MSNKIPSLLLNTNIPNRINIPKLKETRVEFFGTNVIEICKAADISFMALHGEN